ncbi:MAG TPA: hypothetical protein VF623_12985 [Segetibacter sp.]|jgi:hypothetical protein
MPNSNDNQDYGQSDEKNKANKAPSESNNLTTDDLKGKKIDADLTQETDKPAEQKK